MPASTPTDQESATRTHALPDDWWTAGGYDTEHGRIEYDWNQRYWRAVLPDNSSIVFPTEEAANAHLEENGPAVIRRFLARFRS